jgi:hypothetical protein
MRDLETSDCSKMTRGNLEDARFKIMAKARNVAFWGRAELLLVIAAKVRRVFVAAAESSACSVQVFAEHQAACFLKSYLFLKLQGAHGRGRFEVMVKSQNAHSELARDVFNFKGLVEVFA